MAGMAKGLEGTVLNYGFYLLFIVLSQFIHASLGVGM